MSENEALSQKNYGYVLYTFHGNHIYAISGNHIYNDMVGILGFSEIIYTKVEMSYTTYIELKEDK